ncbi:uncharacterized protein N7496_004775 [Penicillium cataractarum]|uniref:BTB domain-containing protein n=1 Tax=Penicillium cataractarum TaxID=2100454 RepID=A0A9W9VFD8_9EURO|nr:uncharacterized protein N7496_004775 [Penicillium cataractarum]KAJ5377366.1 hypothetical protein N7496_004775 [Penicillium cataractarum]
MLEFLYTGDYTTPCSTQTPEITQAKGGDVPEINSKPTEELPRKYRPESDITNEFDMHLHEHLTESATRALDDTPETLMPRPETNDNPALIDESPQITTKDGDESVVTEPLVNSILDCHPSYFHLRMYGEADYFMIDDLKRKAEAHFYASFMSSPKAESFTETIEELYSTRANYLELRQAAIETIIANLPSLRSGPMPVITSELMKSVPDFTYDLLQATLDEYV